MYNFIKELIVGQNRPVFLFVHFFISHPPFIYQEDGYYWSSSPYIQNGKNYARELKYIDKFMGNIMEVLEKNNLFDITDVVLLSDHNYRSLL